MTPAFDSGMDAVATAIGTISWFLRSDGSVWVHQPDGPLGWKTTVRSVAGKTEASPYASLVDQTDYLPLATAPDGSLYAVPNRYAAGADVAKHLVHIRPISGPAGRLTNLSVRAQVTPEAPLIAGFVTAGTGTTRALVRAIGPALADFGVIDALRDPTLTVARNGVTQVENDNWDAALAPRFASIGAFPLAAASRDAALESEIGAGNYTAIIASSTGESGTGLIELYESTDGAAPPRRFINVSARGPVSANAPLVVGFSISGEVPVKVLIRGAGPALASFNLKEFLRAPRLTLFRQTTPLWENDGWDATPFQDATYSPRAEIETAARQAGAFPFAATSGDTAMLLTLAPGSYTAQVGTGQASAAGVALIEEYEVP